MKKILLLVLILGVGFLAGQIFYSLSPPPTATMVQATLVLDFGDEIKTYPNLDGQMVFDLLKKASERDKIKLDYQVYPDLGMFIKQIGDKINGQDGQYWQYWVNDQFALVAADKYQLKGGEMVKWVFRKP